MKDTILKPETPDQFESALICSALRDGIPTTDGWYLVKLKPGHVNCDQPFDVDYCREKSPSDGGGREWVTWHPHNIEGWAEFI